MTPSVRGFVRSLSIAIVAVVAVSCTSGATATPSPSPTPSPTPTPAPTFAFDVVPPEEPAAVRMAIPGESVCFLAVLTADDLRAGAIELASVASGAKVARIVQPTVAAPIGEIWVVPDPSSVETTASVTFTATRGSVVRTVARSLPVFPMIDERAADAQPHFAWWAAWLAANHPELGITAATDWTPQFVSTLLVVSHYAYFSDEWELTVAWHNMIPPDDWSEIHLRHRGTEATPGLAFRQDSMKNNTTPRSVTPPEVPVR